MVKIKFSRLAWILIIFLVIITNSTVLQKAGFEVPGINNSDNESFENSLQNLKDSVQSPFIRFPELPKISIGFLIRLLCFFIFKNGIYLTLFGGFVASIAWFIIKSVMFKDKSVKKMQKDVGISSIPNSLKKIITEMGPQYLATLVQFIIWALVFVIALLLPVLPRGFFNKGIFFGIIMAIVNLGPVYLKLWLESAYPNKLLAINIIKGTIGNIAMAFILVYFIWKLPFSCELTTCNCICGCGGGFFKFLCGLVFGDT